MGIIHHSALLITASDYGTVVSTLDEWLDANTPEEFKDLIVKVGSAANGYVTYMVAPSGSKLGWDTADEHDEFRNKLVKFLDSKAYGDSWEDEDYVTPEEEKPENMHPDDSCYSWVEVSYGELGNEIERTNCRAY